MAQAKASIDAAKKVRDTVAETGASGLTPAQLEPIVRAFCHILDIAKIPYTLLAAHPDDENIILAHGGNVVEKIRMAHEIEMELKSVVAETVINDPSTISAVSTELDRCTKVFGSQRKEMTETLSKALFKGEDPEAMIKKIVSDLKKAYPGMEIKFAEVKQGASAADILSKMASSEDKVN